MAKRFKKLQIITDSIARQVWMLTSLEDKKLVLLDHIGEETNTPEQIKIRLDINSMTTTKGMDVLISNMLLKSEGKGL